MNKPAIRSVEDVKTWLGTFTAEHVADGVGCSCGWSPNDGFGGPREDWPSHAEHVDACLSGELADVLPSSTWVSDGDGGMRQLTFGEFYDEGTDLIDDRDRIEMELENARAWCVDARRRVNAALSVQDPVAGMDQLRRWMNAVDAWERYRGE